MNFAVLTRVEQAAVKKGGIAAAHLTRNSDGVQFGYRDDYAGPTIATTLPLGHVEARAGGALPPFFSGLLPEGRRLGALQRAVKTSADDELSLLLAVGNDTIGDVTVTPPTDSATGAAVPNDAATDLGTPLPADELVFSELFAEVLGATRHDRVGIAGAQDKVSGGMISLPVEWRDAAWILKLDPPEVPHLVANEAFFLRAARASGITTAHAGLIHDRTGKPGLLVRRFDRVQRQEIQAKGALQSLAQEDACQVLGRYPADKYRVTTEEVITALSNLTSAPIVAARDLLRLVAFAYLTGNGDAHAKNFSVLHDGEWRIAPAYDLPSTQPYGDTTMALTIGGKDREDLGRTDFVALGEHCGVRPRATVRVLDELLAAMPAWFDAIDELPFDERRCHRLRKACEYRARRLAP